ncbi:MAG: DUF5662 family protein [Bacteroides sp.]|nr:DUF5662 family protein [Bacteroides sp.]
MKTVLKHKRLVCKFCFKCGLYRQGLTHDLSKLSPAEFIPGARYFSGSRSPNELERSEKGYSSAWLHHKGRNKHHWEYWNDYKKGVGIIPVEMPLKYTAEMCCDRIAACRVYNGSSYTFGDALAYFNKGHARGLMHWATSDKLREWLTLVRDVGEDAAFKRIKAELRDAKRKTS